MEPALTQAIYGEAIGGTIAGLFVLALANIGAVIFWIPKHIKDAVKEQITQIRKESEVSDAKINERIDKFYDENQMPIFITKKDLVDCFSELNHRLDREFKKISDDGERNFEAHDKMWKSISKLEQEVAILKDRRARNN